MKIIIGNKNYSSWSLRAWLAAREGGFNFGEIDIPLFRPDSRERILSHSPSGKVPCLNDNGVLVWDSLAIGEYLAEKQPALLPADPVARATARAVSAEMHAGFRDLRTHMPMNIRKDYRGFGRSPDVDEDIARIIAIWNDCRARFGAGGPYLFGHFTLADAAFAPVCFRCKTYGLEVNGAAGDYLATMLANKHMQEWEAAARAETESIAEEDLYG
ncbi:glutathione S-transferase [Thauera terpenica 58Eu]|jgi:glutathione S-transferase|uniref:Glutathione S-transferase n=1 Tax=Thauera terpenica 58Eu TaxID=1348657 RepID=S9ZIU0_9RHOO|nr:glutathione S-transferase family protein [Thauera terpenica]EPZ17310.1 glutathione S-transferase [Thauera terpenica 58Eu]MBP6725760.1 glutathione S-transferase family protein [Thauera sp.]MBP6761364.1 glutathione S-transferase family protein [Thauera sp.]